MGHYCIALFHRKNSDLHDLLSPYWYDSDEHQEFELQCHKAEAERLFQEFNNDKKNKKTYRDIKDFMSNEHGYYVQNDDGDFGYNTNPNGMYDYFDIGGRWAKTLYGKLTKTQMKQKQEEGLKDKSKFKNEVTEYLRLRMLSPEDYCAEKELLGHTTIACKDFDANRTATMAAKRYNEKVRGDISEYFYSSICEDGGMQDGFKSLLKYWIKKKGYITIVDFHS